MRISKRLSTISIMLLVSIALVGCNTGFINSLENRVKNTAKHKLKAVVGSFVGKAQAKINDKLDTLNIDGKEIDLAKAKIVINGIESHQSDIKEGMVLSVSKLNDKFDPSDIPLVRIDRVVRGLIFENNYYDDGTLNVMGLHIKVGDDTVIEGLEDGLDSIGDLAAGSIVSIYGYLTFNKGSDKQTEVEATRVEVGKGEDKKEEMAEKSHKDTTTETEDDDQEAEPMELMGFVKDLSNIVFSINDLAINYDWAEFENGSLDDLEDGVLVKVSGSLGFNEYDEFVAEYIEIIAQERDEDENKDAQKDKKGRDDNSNSEKDTDSKEDKRGKRS